MTIIENIDIDKAIHDNVDIGIDIDKVILENSNINIDKDILENIDIDTRILSKKSNFFQQKVELVSMMKY